MQVVARYLEAVACFDWETARECLAEDVRRVGPFGDTYTGRDRYLEYLKELMPTLQGYRMDLGRVIRSGDGRSAFVELSETVEIDDRPVVTTEGLVFDLDETSRITGIRIYIQQR
jgi:hypothetical protein